MIRNFAIKKYATISRKNEKIFGEPNVRFIKKKENKGGGSGLKFSVSIIKVFLYSNIRNK